MSIHFKSLHRVTFIIAFHSKSLIYCHMGQHTVILTRTSRAYKGQQYVLVKPLHS